MGQEHRVGQEAWLKSYPRQWPPPPDAMSRPIQGRWALGMLTSLFSWDFVLRSWRVRREMDEGECKRPVSDDPLDSAPTEAELRKVWAQSRRETIRRFRLEGLVSESYEGLQ